jgi:orotate phosphoribosyltransferase
MDLKKDSALKVAEFLLQIKAIRLSPSAPFTWASGWKSPIYCDNRKTLSYPHIRTYIRQQFAAMIEEKFGKPDSIVGVATGGIAQGVLVAQELGVPFAYIRPEPKGHGLKNRIEGSLEPNSSAVVVEDLISTGGSSLSAVSALREEGINVKGMVAIFTYDFEATRKRFKSEKVDLGCLCDYTTLIDQALRSDYIYEKDLEPLKKWRTDPANWGQ